MLQSESKKTIKEHHLAGFRVSQWHLRERGHFFYFLPFIFLEYSLNIMPTFFSCTVTVISGVSQHRQRICQTCILLGTSSLLCLTMYLLAHLMLLRLYLGLGLNIQKQILITQSQLGLSGLKCKVSVASRCSESRRACCA